MIKNEYIIDNYRIEHFENNIDKAEQEKYTSLLVDLENLDKKYREKDFIWLKSNNRTYKYGNENNQFYFFIYCIDWNEIYQQIDGRLTLYDILIKSTALTPTKRKGSFTLAYTQIKKLFDGNINDATELKKCREIILNKITEGLNLLGFKGHCSKGLNEFFKMIFDKIGSVAYETNDFLSSYLTGAAQKSKFLIDFYDKFIPAFEVAKEFNIKYLTKIPEITINRFFALHVLLRHTATFKIKHIYTPNPSGNNRIKNGSGKVVEVTAHKDTEGNTYVVSKDGEFYPPDFSNEQTDLIRFNDSGKELEIDKIAKSLFEKIQPLIKILIEHFNRAQSPNIIDYEQALYAFEFNKHRNDIIEINSFYPLNSDAQLKNGISRKEYDQIVNLSDVPSDYEIKINE